MKKMVALGLAVVILATLGGCGGQKQAARAPQPPVAQPQTAPATAPAPSPSVDMELAKQLLQTQGCSACHTLRAAGLELAGNVGPDLTAEGSRGRTDIWLRQQITSPTSIPDAQVTPSFAGKQMLMPSFSRFSEQELAALIGFLQSLKSAQTPSTALPPSTPSRSPLEIAKSVIIAQSCGSCHTLKNADFDLWGTVGPGLSNEASRHRSQQWLLKQLTNPTAIPDSDIPGYEGQQVVMPSYGRILSDEELAALVQYLMALGSPDAANDKAP
jgi:mono/diheme cytochrome c family protein